MSIYNFFDNNEKPLESLVSDGGFAGIFRTIGCVGDSLSSGEFESKETPEANSGYHDMFEYSWGQYMARTLGNKVYNFSRGGMSAKWYMETFADENDFWNKGKACQAYIIALGVNDLIGMNQAIGTVDDLKEDYTQNADTFAGWYGKIVRRLKEIQPQAKFFFMTMANEGPESKNAAKISEHAKLLYDFTKVFSNSYVIDIANNGPIYDEEFKKKFYMSGHMTPAGYLYTSKIVMSYIDYIIRHNMEDFKQVGFIGTEFKNATVKETTRGKW